MGLFLTIGAPDRVARLARARWRDVALRARGGAPASGRWLSRMLDRVGLMLPAIATGGAAGADPGSPLLAALLDMRIGFVAGELGAMRPRVTGEERALIASTLNGVADHYRWLRPAHTTEPSESILADIDRAVTVFAGDPEPERRREGLILLTSLRRNLFPGAPAYSAGDELAPA